MVGVSQNHLRHTLTPQMHKCTIFCGIYQAKKAVEASVQWLKSKGTISVHVKVVSLIANHVYENQNK